MALQLKVLIKSTGQVKTMRFNPTMSVSEITAEIREKTGEGGRDHGVFQPEDSSTKRNARWLRPEKTLQFYDLQTMDQVEYKKKHRPIKVKLIDGTQKMILIDDSLTIEDIVRIIGGKMDLRNPEEFSLAIKKSDLPQKKGRKKKKRKDSKKGKDNEMAERNYQWLNPTQSLNAQGVPEEAILILKKKFYVGDGNVDRNDQVQLHLVYAQCLDGVITGDHPITKDEAAQFAGLQCQILYGNCDPNKHTKKFLEQRVKEIVPKKYRKRGKLSNYPEIIREWRIIVNMNEINAKYRYIQLCRSLKSYGITYFDVKYKPKSSHTLKPMKLGITRDTVSFVEFDSREILEEHPITHLKRWASGVNTFTLDFGAYRDSYFAMQTREGEFISQLLSGYIDILLKRRKDAGVVLTDDAPDVAQEEFIPVVTGNEGHAITSTEYEGGGGMGSGNFLNSSGGQIPGISGPIAGQVGRATTLGEAEDAILRLMGDVMSPIPIGQHGALSPDELRQDLALKNKQLSSAAGALINATKQGADLDKLNSMAPDLAMNLANLIGAAKMAAAAAKGDVSLLDGAKNVADALRLVMEAAGEVAENPNSAEARMKLARSAALLQAATAALNAQCVGNQADAPSKDLLLNTAKAVAAATKDFLNTADVATANSDMPTKKKEKVGKRKVELRDATVADTVSAVAPVIADPKCKQYVGTSAKALAQACNGLLSGIQGGVKDPNARNDLARTAKAVNEALSQLVNSTACVGSQAEADKEKMAAAAFEIQDALAKLMSADRNPQQIVAAGKAIQVASRTLVDAAKGVAKNADPAEKNRLLDAMKDLTRAVGGMLQTAAQASTNPDDDNLHQRLRDQGNAVGEATRRILGDVTTKQAAMAALRSAAKASAAATSGLIAECREVGLRNDPSTRADLSKAAADAAHAVADLVKGVKDSWTHPDDPKAEMSLKTAAKNSGKPSAGLVSSARAAVPRVKDRKDKQSLNAAATQVSNCLRKLMDALKAAKEADGHMEVDEALMAFAATAADMDFAIASAEDGEFDPIPNQTRDGALGLLNASTGELQRAADELRTASKKSPKAMGPPAKKTTTALNNVMRASKAVASTLDTAPSQAKVLKAAKGVADETERLLNAGRALSMNPDDPVLNKNTNAARMGIDSAVDYLLASAANSGAGAEECEAASAAIAKAAMEALSGMLTNPRGDLQEFAENLGKALKALDSAISQVADAARNNPKQLGPSANLTASTLPPILNSANNASAKTPDKVAGSNILAKAKQLADDTGYFLTAAKVLSSKPNDFESDQALGDSMKDVRADMAELLKAVDAGIPGKREMMQAQDAIEAANARLYKPSVPTDNPQVHLREISDAARQLAEAVGRIVASSHHFPEKLGPYAIDAANAVSDILDAAKDASSADPASDVYLATARVDSDAEGVTRNPRDIPEVVEATKRVARDTGDLLNSIRRAAQKSDDPNVRRPLIQAADAATRAVAQLATAAKDVGQKKPGAEQQLADAAKQLHTRIQAIMRANPRGRYGQDFIPLLEAARILSEETQKMVDILKVISGKPKDAAAQTQLAVAAQKTGEAIRGIIEASDNLTYGHKETLAAVACLQKALGDLDAAGVQATVPGLLQIPASKAGTSNQQCKEELIALSRELASVTSALVTASKNKPEELGPAALQATRIVPQIVESTIALAATTTDPEAQRNQLKAVKSSIDSLLTLVKAAKATSGKPYDKEILMSLANAAKAVSGSITELVSSLRGGVLGLRACDEAMKQIDSLRGQLDSKANPKGKTYAQCIIEVQGNAKDMVGAMAHMVAAAKNAQNQPEKVGETCLSLAKAMPTIIMATRMAAGATPDEEVSLKLLGTGKDVVNAFYDCVAGAKTVAADPKNSSAVVGLSEVQTGVTDALGQLLSALRDGDTLERDANLSVAKIQATTSDLDSAALFAAATAGQMEVDLGKGDTLDRMQASLTSNAKKLASTCGSMVQASKTGKTSQEALGNQFKTFATEIANMAESTKGVCSLLGDLPRQQEVLASAKAMTISSQALVLAAKEAALNPNDGAAKQQLDKSSATASNAMKQLVQVSQAASNDAVAGIRELDKAQAQIKRMIADINKPGNGGSVKPREVLPCLRNLGTATGQLVANATSNKNGLVKSAQDTTRYMDEMFVNIKGLDKLLTGEYAKVKGPLRASTKETANATLQLLEKAKAARDTPESQKELASLSESVADKIMDTVKHLRELPGGENIKGLHDSGPDFDSIAEQELKKAAKMIENAANRLLQSRPRQVESDFITEEDINAAILEAARAITMATGSLVKAAVFAQRERIAKRRDPKTKAFYRADPAWANGLISAAQTVGATTQDLVTSANGFVQREEGMDDAMLISSARQVAGATARLMAASRAKSDPYSQTHKNLGSASKEVANATQMLVEAARRAAEWVNQPQVVDLADKDISSTEARKRKLEAQARMLRLQAELERAQANYSDLHKKDYGNVSKPVRANPNRRGGGRRGGAPRGRGRARRRG